LFGSTISTSLIFDSLLFTAPDIRQASINEPAVK
jgi:hypothetical protein